MFEADGFGSQAKLLSEKHQLFRTFLARQRLRTYPSARSKQLPQWTSPTGTFEYIVAFLHDALRLLNCIGDLPFSQPFLTCFSIHPPHSRMLVTYRKDGPKTHVWVSSQGAFGEQSSDVQSC
jgi:hypothetical protein